MSTPTRHAVHLRGEHCSLVLSFHEGDDEPMPTVVHWGARIERDDDIDSLVETSLPAVTHSGADVAARWRLVPMPTDGWPLRPALEGARGDGSAYSPRFHVSEVRAESDSATIEGRDDIAGLAITIDLRLHEGGVLTWNQRVTNTQPGTYHLTRLSAALSLPTQATELLDLTGRWCRERAPQRTPLHMGAWVREGRRGRTGHDAPTVLVAGRPGFSFREGEVFGMHVAWSGNTTWYAERSPHGIAQLGGGELLEPGEVRLAEGESYDAPTVMFVHRNDGLDGLSDAFHRYTRARDCHVATPRPVILNTWEAVYFDHRLDRLTALADVAAEVGVERFVLDDGWFGSRRDDTKGLGDWTVSTEVWPDGLTPLIKHVTGLGMQFGLWVEPEMVNPDSDLYRAHPDWILSIPGRLPQTWRHQQVLDLHNPDAYAHVLTQLDALLRDNDIAYLKWDHNRDLTDTGHAGVSGVRTQTLALYALLDELRRRHPGVEIESCASGGGRVDLGILDHTDRVWASDCIDPLERQMIQRWTALLLPPELVGAHVPSDESHTTGRRHGLGFRLATAFFGHMGVEVDLTATSPEERSQISQAVALHKELRPLLHGGTTVRVDHPVDEALVHGVVSHDRDQAVFAYVQLTSGQTHTPGRARLAGLDPQRRYRIEPLVLGPQPSTQQITPPQWITAGGAELSGAALMNVGVQIPILRPEQSFLVRLTS